MYGCVGSKMMEEWEDGILTRGERRRQKVEGDGLVRFGRGVGILRFEVYFIDFLGVPTSGVFIIKLTM